MQPVVGRIPVTITIQPAAAVLLPVVQQAPIRAAQRVAASLEVAHSSTSGSDRRIDHVADVAQHGAPQLLAVLEAPGPHVHQFEEVRSLALLGAEEIVDCV